MKQLTDQQRRTAIERLTRLGYRLGDYVAPADAQQPKEQQNKTEERPRP